ncbi:MAG: hypothetical protein M3004_11285 [Bacteroidota bacterium]|nr:hypothetical protein [Bacteroidota bacterium]
MKTKNCLALIICVVFFIISCSKGGSSTQPAGDPCAGLSFKFGADVQPIINANCANSSNCHGAGSSNTGGPLTDYAKIFAKSSTIKIQVESGSMPKNGSLSATDKNKIICWINSGAPNN